MGLLALKNIISKYEYEIDDGKEPVNRLTNNIFPILENLIVFLWDNDAVESHSLLIEMLRIFYLTNQLQIIKSFMNADRMDKWVSLFKKILDRDLNNELEQPTEEWSVIVEREKTKWWKLKSLCAQSACRIM